MRKNYKLNTEQGIKKITLLSSTIIILTVATIIGFVLIKTQYDNFKTRINSFESTLIEREKFYIKTSVENLKNDITFEELSILNNKKERIKNQAIVAYNLAHSLYNKTQYLSKKEQILFIKSSLNQMSQKSNDINYFILNMQGDLILNSENKKDENKNYFSSKDINGSEFIKKIIHAEQNKQNYVEYTWYKPNSTLTSKKITYSTHLKELGIIIGSGSFVDKSNEKLKKTILKKISNLSYNKEEFVFLYYINSLNNIKEESTLLIEKNILSSLIDKKAMNDLLINTNYKGNDYIFYQDNERLLYGTFISHLRFFISAGVDLSHIQKISKKERMAAEEEMYEKIISLIVVITIITLIFFVFSFLFTKKITLIFENYKKNVILNEEKYHLLFNHSNDAFLISELSTKSAKIINFNKTALKVSSFTEKEILKKDFFELFFELELQALLKTKSIRKTVKMKIKNHQIKTIELDAVIYTNEKQQLLFASLRDITERTLLKVEKEKQEKLLIQKSKMAAMGEMIGNIAHQWRQPLSQVSGLFVDIESAYMYKELNKEYLQNRVNEANDLIEYMSKTIDDFRNFFNPNAKKELFSLKDSMRDTAKIIQSTLDYHHISLQINLCDDIELYAYRNEYSQAILNIISNAKDILIEKKIKDPIIKIYLENKNVLCIEDNAGGIDESIIKKIFDPYFTTKFEYGTGIGLYMTQLIIENKMNGSITAENTNKGALFKIKV
ncbi:MAG: cache domain-containing protein [Campylobacteraceae bacterium]|nr:cache domain-containing protein [Campylobacteraceae bacterium]